jgi:hypothetical protein
VDDQPFLAQPFHAERIAAVEGAEPRDVLYRLISHRELLVSVRDLALTDPATPPLERLVAAQMRRMSGSFPSAAKTSYFAMVTHAVLEARPHNDAAADQLRQVLHSSDLGRQVHLVCVSVGFHGEHAVANLRVVARGLGTQQLTPMLEYKLAFAPSGPQLTGFAFVREDGNRAYLV